MGQEPKRLDALVVDVEDSTTLLKLYIGRLLKAPGRTAFYPPLVEHGGEIVAAAEELDPTLSGRDALLGVARAIRDVAVEKAGGKRTYMNMGTVGVGLGLGGKKYQVVFLFEDVKRFNGFVEKGWQADTSATAAAGNKAAEAGTGFVDGIAIYQITDKGLMAQADIAGTKYWKDDKLNETK